MKRILGARFLILFTALCAISGFLLRSAYNHNGDATAQIIVSVIAVAVIAAVSLLLKKQEQFASVFVSSVLDFVLCVLAAVLFAAFGVLRLVRETGFQRVIGILAIIASVCLLLTATMRLQKKTPNTFGYISILIFYIVKLFYDFRRWMVDPAILDYCFLLFSAISFMLASFYAARFCYNRGKRSLLVMSSLCGVFFGFACLPDLQLAELLLYVGSILWMLSCAWQALRNVEEKE